MEDQYESYEKANRFMDHVEARSPNRLELARFREFCKAQGYSPNSVAGYLQIQRSRDG